MDNLKNESTTSIIDERITPIPEDQHYEQTKHTRRTPFKKPVIYLAIAVVCAAIVLIVISGFSNVSGAFTTTENVSTSEDSAEIQQDTSDADESSESMGDIEALQESEEVGIAPEPEGNTTSDSPSGSTPLATQEPKQEPTSDASTQLDNKSFVPDTDILPPSPQEEAPPIAEKAPETISVSVYVDSSQAPGYPASLSNTTVTIPVNSTVYAALLATGVSVGGGSSYVTSISGLSAGTFGGESGWKYSVNGIEPSISSGSYTLAGGESIRWRFVLTANG